MKVILSPLVELKLAQSLDVIEKKWGLSSKKKFLLKLTSAIRTIEKFPEAFPKSIREFELHKCVVTRQTSLFYRIESDRIEIITVFDNRQNPKRLADEIRMYFD